VSRFLRLVWLCLGVGAFAFLVVLFLLPTRWDVERQQEIAAPRERVFPLLADLRAWQRWSPWQESAYKGLVYRYSNPASGAGAQVTWNSEATGDGMLRLDRATAPQGVDFSMAFQHGRIEAHDTLTLAALPGGRTRVTWSDHGSLGHTLVGRLSLRLIEMSMGRDLERGLANLAAVAEGRPLPPPPAAPTPPPPPR
jgi:hypothetical protein